MYGDIKVHEIDSDVASAGSTPRARAKRNPATSIEAAARDARNVLRSVLEPSAEITEGYATVSVTKRDGSVVSGTLVSEQAEELVLRVGEDDQRVPLAEVKERIGPVSAMPPAGLALSPAELRDLVAYVAAL